MFINYGLFLGLFGLLLEFVLLWFVFLDFFHFSFSFIYLFLLLIFSFFFCLVIRYFFCLSIFLFVTSLVLSHLLVLDVRLHESVKMVVWVCGIAVGMTCLRAQACRGLRRERV